MLKPVWTFIIKSKFVQLNIFKIIHSKLTNAIARHFEWKPNFTLVILNAIVHDNLCAYLINGSINDTHTHTHEANWDGSANWLLIYGPNLNDISQKVAPFECKMISNPPRMQEAMRGMHSMHFISRGFIHNMSTVIFEPFECRVCINSLLYLYEFVRIGAIFSKYLHKFL